MSLFRPQSEMILAPAQFQQLRDLLASYSGVYIDESRQRVLTSGLAQRLAATALDLQTYAAHIASQAGRGELQQLAELVLNHETIFFRNLPHIRALREVILPQIHRHKPPGMPLRIWSAGCATGEEPYSLAMTVLETLGPPLPRPVEIWATDLSERALLRAREGTYSDRALTNVTPQQRSRFFERRGAGWTISAAARSLVTFEQLNLLEPFPATAQGIDLVFCQNVTIYFQLDTCRKLMERFYAAMPDGGMLFLGFSETLWNIFDGFRSLEIGGAFVYYKGSDFWRLPRPSQAPAARLPVASGRSARQPAPATARSDPRAPRPLRATRPATASALPAPAPDAATDLLQRGRELLADGRANEALELLARSPLNGPDAPQILVLVARAHANRGDLDLAVAEARRAIELDSLTSEAYMLLGVIYMQQQQVHAAVQQFERARYLEPGAPLISFHLAEAYRRLQRTDMAMREYRNALRKLDAHPPDVLLDGVAVGWLRETCQRYVTMLSSERR